MYCARVLILEVCKARLKTLKKHATSSQNMPDIRRFYIKKKIRIFKNLKEMWKKTGKIIKIVSA